MEAMRTAKLTTTARGIRVGDRLADPDTEAGPLSEVRQLIGQPGLIEVWTKADPMDPTLSLAPDDRVEVWRRR